VLEFAVFSFLILAVPAAYLISLIWLHTLPRVKSKDRCGKCGYTRTGLANLAVCPECGHTHGKLLPERFRSQAASADLRNRLILIPLVLGLLASLIAVPAAYIQGGLMAAAAIPLFGVCAVLPGVLTGLIVPGRVSPSMAWTICLSGALPSVAICGYLGVMTLLQSDYQMVAAATMAPIFGGFVSLALSAIIGSITAAVYQRRMREARAVSG
jgi:hypothetical protein